MMTETEYEQNEARELLRKLREVESAPLADRREARKDWFEAMSNPGLIGERIEWLFNGSYGKGAYDRAWAIAENTRGNRAAQLGQLLAALDCNCPANFAAEAWNTLNHQNKKRVNKEIMAAMESALAEKETEVV